VIADSGMPPAVPANETSNLRSPSPARLVYATGPVLRINGTRVACSFNAFSNEIKDVLRLQFGGGKQPHQQIVDALKLSKGGIQMPATRQ
jgi:hypothetical protein